MSKKSKIKLFLGIIVTAVILYYSVKSLGSLHYGKVLHWHINWWLIAISVAIYIFANYVRALAYTRGIDPEMDRMTAFRIVGIGHSANMILPLHAGEGLRFAFFPTSYSLTRRTKLLIIPAAADFIAIMALSLLAVPFAGFKNPNLLKALWILSFLCIAGVILFIIGLFLVPPLRNYTQGYMNIGTVKMMFWVMLSWILLLVSTWISILAFGFHMILSIRMSLAIFAATNIINFIPASPGAIGLFEYASILALGGLGIGQGRALMVSLVLHMIQYVALLPMGAVLYISAIYGKYGEAMRAKRKRK